MVIGRKVHYSAMNRFASAVLAWAESNLRDFEWRRGHASPFRIFLAEMLLKRTTATAAATVYPVIVKKFPNVRTLAATRPSEIKEIIRPIGYPQRAREMVTAANFVVENFGGRLPNDKDRLLEIPFVGDYTASAILSLAFGKPYAMVDSNVNRVISRALCGKGPVPHITKDIRELAGRVLPAGRHREFNLAMLDIGGTVCLPRYPKCPICPLAKACKFNAGPNKHPS